MIVSTTEIAIRLLSSLKKKSIVASSRGKIILLDKEKLRSLSQGAD
jgi:hypothetical protein